MSRGPRSRASDDAWQPTASWSALGRRAALIARIREFFAARGVLEVETPLLSAATVTDPHLHSLETRLEERPFYLQTSPEFAMKRLLAAASGAGRDRPIYQICKAFRGGESGRRHNPEFTLLEWYRPGFDHHALMGEIDELLGDILGTAAATRRTYAEVFAEHLGFDPHTADVATLRRAAAEHALDVAGLEDAGRDDWLSLLLAVVVEPHLGRGRPTFVLDFPASQAALARLKPGDPTVAERFEVFVEGVELANGFHELADAGEQRRRFLADLEARAAAGLEAVPVDERLLAALEAGLPDCAGVALGVDRLVMLALEADSLEEVVGFPIDRA